MEVLEVLLKLLANLSIIAKDPALGVKGQAITTLLTLATLAKQGSEGLQALKEMSGRVEIMVKEGREPTEEEWAELRKRSDEAHATIQSFKPGESTDAKP